MEKLKIGMIGAGWRAHGYMRVIRELSHRMEISGIYVHSRQSGVQMEQEYPGKVEKEWDAFLRREHDFVMLLVPRQDAGYYLEKLLEKAIPVLMETPPGDGMEQLQQCYRWKEIYGGKIQVAEQYFLQPYHCAVQHVLRQNILGTVSNVELSLAHDYHGISLMRNMLESGFQNCRINARKYTFPVQFHCGRDGLMAGSEKIIPDQRKRADFVFEDGKVGFFDFSGEQYFNYFRTRHMNVRGEYGEIYDTQMAVLGAKGLPVTGQILRDETGAYSNLEGCGLRSLTWNGQTLYENPYWKEGARLSDDEIGMASLLDGMARYVRTGEEIYALEEALQDTYLYLMMDASIKQRREVETERQIWMQK